MFHVRGMHRHNASCNATCNKVVSYECLRVRLAPAVVTVLRIPLFLLAAVICCGASPSDPPHNLIVDLDDSSCHQALETFGEQSPDTINFLRPDWRTHYRIETDNTLDVDFDALWDRVHAQWRVADFDRALTDADVALDAIRARGSDAMSDSLLSIAQLRITTLLLKGEHTQARDEGALLLSRKPSSFYCANTAFPEACDLLRTLESTHTTRWELADADLTQLSKFSNQMGRNLTVVSRPEGRVRWDLIESGERTRHHISEGDCSTQVFWENTLEQWNALLSTDLLSTPPPPSSPIALQRTMRIGVPIVATVVSGLAIASTVNLRQRRKRFDGCLVSAQDCATYDDIQASKVDWVRARRTTAAAWTAVGVVGLSPIPLTIFKNRAIKRSEASASRHVHRE